MEGEDSEGPWGRGRTGYREATGRQEGGASQGSESPLSLLEVCRCSLALARESFREVVIHSESHRETSA